MYVKGCQNFIYSIGDEGNRILVFDLSDKGEVKKVLASNTGVGKKHFKNWQNIDDSIGKIKVYFSGIPDSFYFVMKSGEVYASHWWDVGTVNNAKHPNNNIAYGIYDYKNKNEVLLENYEPVYSEPVLNKTRLIVF